MRLEIDDRAAAVVPDARFALLAGGRAVAPRAGRCPDRCRLELAGEHRAQHQHGDDAGDGKANGGCEQEGRAGDYHGEDREDYGAYALHGFALSIRIMWGPILSIARPNPVALAGCDKARHKGRMNKTPHHHPLRLRRSVLSVPAGNARALAKSATLDCDAYIFDLEDSVLPEKKAEARAALVAHFEGLDRSFGREHVIRINPIDGPDGVLDLEAVLDCMPDAVLLPKVSEPQDLLTVADWLSEAGSDEGPRLWAMIETAAALLNMSAIAETGRTHGGRLDCFVVGLNDLRKETGIADIPGRPFLVPLLLQVVVAARASGLDVVDAVFNDFSDTDGLEAECRQGRQMGFDGKMLIHPAQVAIANEAFGVAEGEAAEALAIVAAFAAPENAGKAVIDLRGRMVEKLHADQAGRLLAKVDLINERKTTT